MMSFNKGFFGNDGRKTYSEITARRSKQNESENSIYPRFHYDILMILLLCKARGVRRCLRLVRDTLQ